MEPQDITIHSNRMALHTIDAFYHINGRFSGKEKDVYFLRYIGFDEEASYRSRIVNGDRAMSGRKTGYCRVSELPRRIPEQELSFYTTRYLNFISKAQEPGFRYRSEAASLNRLLFRAFRNILDFYRREARASDTICKNFAVKCFYWLDLYCPLLFPPDGSLAVSPKFVYAGPIKIQEYLFLYLLNQSGCDILYLNSKEDLSLPPSCKALSTLHLDAQLKEIRLPEYARDQGKQEIQTSPAQSNEDAGKKLRPVDIHTRPARTRRRQKSAGILPGSGMAGRQDSIIIARPSAPSAKPAARPTRAGAAALSGTASRSGRTPLPLEALSSAEARELAYEELANMASSVVMVAALDRKGDCFKTGSGVMLGENGYLLTNFHVVSEASSYAIRLEDDEETYETDELLKYHPLFDLAILRISKKCRPIPLYRKQSPLARGQKVVAIGSPLGLFNSVSDGIISGFRTIHDTPMIQFTAPTSHGSSGGALLNLYGELIGLCTAGFDDGQNLNLAVDYKTIAAFAGNLLH